MTEQERMIWKANLILEEACEYLAKYKAHWDDPILNWWEGRCSAVIFVAAPPESRTVLKEMVKGWIEFARKD